MIAEKVFEWQLAAPGYATAIENKKRDAHFITDSLSIFINIILKN